MSNFSSQQNRSTGCIFCKELCLWAACYFCFIFFVLFSDGYRSMDSCTACASRAQLYRLCLRKRSSICVLSSKTSKPDKPKAPPITSDTFCFERRSKQHCYTAAWVKVSLQSTDNDILTKNNLSIWCLACCHQQPVGSDSECERAKYGHCKTRRKQTSLCALLFSVLPVAVDEE